MKHTAVATRSRTIVFHSLLFLGSVSVLWCEANSALAQQWTTNGSNINNTNTGNVGIGTTTPAAKLDVTTNAGANLRLNATGSNWAALKFTKGSANWQLETNGDKFFITDLNIVKRALAIAPSTGYIGIGTENPAARLHIGSSTASETIGAIFELPPNPVSNLPLIQWQGGNDYGKWRNYINHAEKGFILTYNMPYNYQTNDFDARDVETGADNSAYLWYDGLEGAYNFWTMGFGASMVGQHKANLNEGGRFFLRQGSSGFDENGQGVVPTIFEVISPTNADAVYQMVAGNGQNNGTGVAFIASGNNNNLAPNLLSIVGYNPGYAAPCPACPGAPDPQFVKTLMTMHTDTGNIAAATGDVAISTQSKGLILKATDGPNCYRLTVNNSGTLATAPVTCQ